MKKKKITQVFERAVFLGLFALISFFEIFLVIHSFFILEFDY